MMMQVEVPPPKKSKCLFLQMAAIDLPAPPKYTLTGKFWTLKKP